MRQRSWFRNNDGAAAVEFALVALPFLLFVMGIIGISFYFFTSNTLQHGVEDAARKIRTGEAQKGAMTIGGFRDLVCTEVGSYIDCKKLSVLVQHAPTWSGVSAAACTDDKGNMVPSTGASDDEALIDYAGEASEVVLITLCYKWDMAELFSFLNLGNGPNGSGPAIVQSATAFRTEPYS